MSKLYAVAEAIMDSSAEEFRAINLASTSAVQDYASNGMGIELTDAEAAKIRNTLLAHIDSEDQFSTNAWHHSVKVPLSN